MVATAPQVTFVRRERLQTQCFRERLAPDRDPDLVLTMVQIPAGSFLMGSTPSASSHRPAEGPRHGVKLESFFLSQTPITQAQWREVAQWRPRERERWGRELSPNPSRFQTRDEKGAARLLAGETNTDHRPVERVSWHDALEFCHRLSHRTGLTYSLPSEAQWEYACRADSNTSPFHFGKTITPKLANYNGNSSFAYGPEREYRQQTTPVGIFPANGWGLQDMHGNVWEWCLDHWHRSYDGAPSDGSAWQDGEGSISEKISETMRVLRGGSWLNGPRICSSACRSRGRPGSASFLVGFRVVCLPQDPSLKPSTPQHLAVS